MATFRKNKLLSFKKTLDFLLTQKDFLWQVDSAKKILLTSFEKGGKVLICGNGGSATQASHMAGELIGRFGFDRPALPAISLFDLAATTAIGNDYGFDQIFSRFVLGLGKANDLLFSISTSGNSQNCLLAMKTAQKIGLKNISLLGKDGGKMKSLSDLAIIVPVKETPLIQEIHLMIIHYLCEEIEKHFFQKKDHA